MISVENLSKSFGNQTLFESVSFKINPRERIGLVGRNGHGKTTLFRILTGQEDVDTGSVGIPKNYRIGYVQQSLRFTRGTVLQECMTGLTENEKDHFWKAEKILAGLGFAPGDFPRSPDEFSGGYQVRLNLAKVLVAEPDLLLLDEPTNYLDLPSIRWIVRFLNNWPHECLLITHDRGFMDQVVTHIMGIHRCKLRKLQGKTEKYYARIAQDEEIYEKTRINDEKRHKEIEQFITRFRAKARLANLVQSRIKTLEKIKKKEKLTELQTLDFSFREHPFPGKQVLSAEELSFTYDPDLPLIRKFSVHIRTGERWCVIGKNGKGKTTLLKLLAEKLVPQKGRLAYNPNTKLGLFEQTNIQLLEPTRTVEEEILYTDPDVGRQRARNICGAMMFPGDDALKKISVLSGGEKSRVMLGKLLLTPSNLLLLDEPTNHLDMESCDSLLTALDHFNGTVLMVTHNEMFLHTLAEKLIIFQDDRVQVFEGSYRDFLEKIGWQEEGLPPRGRSLHSDRQSGKPGLTKKEWKQKRSLFYTERTRAMKPIEQRVQQLENDIDQHENELVDLNAAMVKASQDGNSEEIAVLSRRIHHHRITIDTLFDELEESAQSLEEIKADFQERWKALQE